MKEGLRFFFFTRNKQKTKMVSQRCLMCNKIKRRKRPQFGRGQVGAGRALNLLKKVGKAAKQAGKVVKTALKNPLVKQVLAMGGKKALALGVSQLNKRKLNKLAGFANDMGNKGLEELFRL